MKISHTIKKPFGVSLLLLLLLIASLVFFSWTLAFSFYSNLDYAYFFFEEIYIINLVTLFGFLLVASSTLINTASSAVYHSNPSFLEDKREEEHEKQRRGVINDISNLCLYLFALFLFSVSYWFLTLRAIQEENTTQFYIYSSICIVLMISLIALTISQMYISAHLKKGSAESYKNKGRNNSILG